MKTDVDVSRGPGPLIQAASDDDALRAFARTCALQVVYLWPAPEAVRTYLETGDPTLRNKAHKEAWAFIRNLSHEDDDSPRSRAAYSAAYACSRNVKPGKFVANAAAASARQAFADSAGDPESQPWTAAMVFIECRQRALLAI